MLLRGDQNGVGINASVESRATCDHGVRAAFEQCQLSDDRDQHRHAGRFSLAFDCGSAPEFNHCSVHVHSIDMKIHLTGHAAKSGLDHVHNPSGGGRAFGRSYDAIENYILVESQRDFVSHFGGLRCHRGSEDKMHRCALREDNFSGGRRVRASGSSGSRSMRIRSRPWRINRIFPRGDKTAPGARRNGAQHSC